MPTLDGPARAGAPTENDQPTSSPPPRWPRLVVVGALLPLGILGALALSAAATISKVARHGVPGVVQPAAVAMLEVVSIAATLLAIFATTKRLRDRAMAVLIATSAVQLFAGWSAYGWVGLIAPALAVALVHLAAEAWQELRADRGAAAAWGDRAAVDVAPDAEPVPAVPVVPVDQPADEADQDEADTAEVPARDLSGPVLGPPTLLDWLRARPVMPSERGLLRELDPTWTEETGGELGLTRHWAKTTLREARTGMAVAA